MFELIDISKSYQTGAGCQIVLDKVSTCLREPALVAILGPSGCGKTTLLNILGGLDHDFTGTIVIDGVSTNGFSEDDWDEYRARRIGFVFQEASLIDHLSVEENVRVALNFTANKSDMKSAGAHARIKSAMRQAGVDELSSRMPRELSGGQQQRVAIARALVKNPDVILADEPTGSLDADSSVQVMEVLAEVAREKLVVVVTHDRSIAEKYATRIIEINDLHISADSALQVGAGELSSIESAESNSEKSRYGVSSKKENAKKPRLNNLFSGEHYWGIRRIAHSHMRNNRLRTALTIVVVSIGLVGLSLMLALRAGAFSYMNNVAESSLIRNPIVIQEDGSASALRDVLAHYTLLLSHDSTRNDIENVQVDPIAQNAMTAAILNMQPIELESFMRYLNNPDNGVWDLAYDIQTKYPVDINLYTEDDTLIVSEGASTFLYGLDLGRVFGTDATNAIESVLPDPYDLARELVYNESTGASPYRVLAGRMPENAHEIVIITNKDGVVSDYFLYATGIADTRVVSEAASDVMMGKTPSVPEQKAVYDFEELLGITFKIVPNCDYYHKVGPVWVFGRSDRSYMRTVLSKADELIVVGVVAPGEGVNDVAETGSLGYSSELIPYLINVACESPVVRAQQAQPGVDVLCGLPFSDDRIEGSRLSRQKLSLVDAMNRPEFSQAKRDYVDSLSYEQLYALNERFGNYFDANGKLTLSYNEYAGLAEMSDEEFIALIERYAPANLNVGYARNMAYFGVCDLSAPTAIWIYPAGLDQKRAIEEKIDEYNERLQSDDTGVRGATRGGQEGAIVQQRHNEARIVYASANQVEIDQVQSSVATVTLLIAVLVVVSLIVSVLMVLSVTAIAAIERRREIGILRALGATRNDVIHLLGVENIVIGSIAGFAGCSIACIASLPLNMLLSRLAGQASLVALPWWSLPVVVVIGALLAVVSGWVPVMRAASVDPVASLK